MARFVRLTLARYSLPISISINVDQIVAVYPHDAGKCAVDCANLDDSPYLVEGDYEEVIAKIEHA